MLYMPGQKSKAAQKPCFGRDGLRDSALVGV